MRAEPAGFRTAPAAARPASPRTAARRRRRARRTPCVRPTLVASGRAPGTRRAARSARSTFRRAIRSKAPRSAPASSRNARTRAGSLVARSRSAAYSRMPPRPARVASSQTAASWRAHAVPPSIAWLSVSARNSPPPRTARRRALARATRAAPRRQRSGASRPRPAPALAHAAPTGRAWIAWPGGDPCRPR